MTQVLQSPVEQIQDGEVSLAWIFHHEYEPAWTEFPTPDDFSLQVGYVVYPAGGEIAAHRHRPLERRVHRTAEVLLVKKGRALADLYSEDDRLVVTRELREGDVLLLLSGGHGFRMLEDTVFVEVKQGPYLGDDEKEPL